MPYGYRKGRTRKSGYSSRSQRGSYRSTRVRRATRTRKSRVSSRRQHSPRIVIQLVNPAAAPSAQGQKGLQP